MGADKYLEKWKAKLQSAYSIMLKYSKITVCPSDSDFLYNDQFCLGKNLVVWPPTTALAKLCQLTCLTAPEPLNKTFGIVLDGLRVTHWVIATKFDLKNH